MAVSVQGAARMLLRVTWSLELFDKHRVAILTSAVIECQRGGLPHQAHRLALVLMRPENRGRVQPQYRRKLEAMLLERPLIRCMLLLNSNTAFPDMLSDMQLDMHIYIYIHIYTNIGYEGSMRYTLEVVGRWCRSNSEDEVMRLSSDHVCNCIRIGKCFMRP